MQDNLLSKTKEKKKGVKKILGKKTFEVHKVEGNLCNLETKTVDYEDLILLLKPSQSFSTTMKNPPALYLN